LSPNELNKQCTRVELKIIQPPQHKWCQNVNISVLNYGTKKRGGG
jgi:hypothetical protein